MTMTHQGMGEKMHNQMENVLGIPVKRHNISISNWTLSHKHLLGISLVEVLVVIAILVVGLWMAMNIFPTGTRALKRIEAQDIARHIAQRLAREIANQGGLLYGLLPDNPNLYDEPLADLSRLDLDNNGRTEVRDLSSLRQSMRAVRGEILRVREYANSAICLFTPIADPAANPFIVYQRIWYREVSNPNAPLQPQQYRVLNNGGIYVKFFQPQPASNEQRTFVVSYVVTNVNNNPPVVMATDERYVVDEVGGADEAYIPAVGQGLRLYQSIGGELQVLSVVELHPCTFTAPTNAIQRIAGVVNLNTEDDDGDGKMNEDPPNGADDDSDGQIDEDPPGAYCDYNVDSIGMRITEYGILRHSTTASTGGELRIFLPPVLQNSAGAAIEPYNDNDGDGREDEDPADGVDNDYDGNIDEDPPEGYTAQSPLNASNPGTGLLIFNQPEGSYARISYRSASSAQGADHWWLLALVPPRMFTISALSFRGSEVEGWREYVLAPATSAQTVWVKAMWVGLLVKVTYRDAQGNRYQEVQRVVYDRNPPFNSFHGAIYLSKQYRVVEAVEGISVKVWVSGLRFLGRANRNRIVRRGDVIEAEALLVPAEQSEL